MNIEIVIPILNEEKTLRKQVFHLKSHLRKYDQLGHKFIITIADNGSTDRSSLIGSEIARTVSGIKYVKLAERGVGRALKRCWQDSEAEVIGFMDLDFATDLNHLEQCWALLRKKEIDIVCGTRNQKESNVVNRSLKRTITSRTLNAIIRIVFRTSFTDAMCGFKFLKRNALPTILENGVGFDDWFFSSEILIVAEHLNLNINELPVSWIDDKDSKVRILGLTMMYLKDIVILKRKLSITPSKIS